MSLKRSLESMFDEHGISGDPELEAYKTRVMLAHVRVMGQRNLPRNLSPATGNACDSLVNLLHPDLVAHTQNI